MPRKPPGDYANRDSAAAAAQPVRTPTGLPYGEANQLEQAQRAAPLAGAPPAAAAPNPQPQGGLAQALEAARGMAMPLTNLRSPTERPNEPVTAGLPVGAGPGPSDYHPDPMVKVAAIFNSLGDAADASTKAIRDLVNASVANQGAP